jgi:hypothetical protein
MKASSARGSGVALGGKTRSSNTPGAEPAAMLTRAPCSARGAVAAGATLERALGGALVRALGGALASTRPARGVGTASSTCEDAFVARATLAG